MVTFSFILIIVSFFGLLATIDSFFYEITFLQSLMENIAPKAETRRYQVTTFLILGFFYSCFVDYRLKKSKQ
ncbi:hypothetical protein [Litchfieldia alkalitelluris]|uniref:hypothetical protein n=1 Tax=Litchfieldia alkalitelluris TaxID=304268 RepID=UPI000996AA07|nr:hypothetical protein [Litchfieldia alkalitelluris]